MFPKIAFLYLSWLLLAAFVLGTIASTNMLNAPNTAKPGCQHKCGNLVVPYPFGIGLDGKCSIGRWYNVNCDTSVSPPKAFISNGDYEIVGISENELRIKNSVARICYNTMGTMTSNEYGWIDISRSPFTFSSTANTFTVLGCDSLGIIQGTSGQNFTGGCISSCSRKEDVIEDTCSGIGCCQTPIPNGLNTFIAAVSSLRNHTNISSFNPCTYGFLAETDRFKFRGVRDLSDRTLSNRTVDHVPVVLDWDVGNGTSCSEAKKDLATYTCQGNTSCSNSDSASRGYHCSCLPGYEGNPYISPGCTDIDECADETNYCSHVCTNIPGSYKCSCPKGQKGDGLKTGKGCDANNSQLVLKSALGTSLGVLFLFTCASLAFLIIRNRKLAKMRETFFEKNGGLLLRQQLSSNQGSMDSTKIFTADELKSATNNYSEDRILGKGGYGTVYKGILPDNHVVAIKKSKIADQSQIEQFINEVVILTQINHRNVVKLLGCCLETEVPLLVYEYVSNGTLLDHINNRTRASWLTWANIVRIASEAADAISYLHSAANPPIIHRDIKSTNILVDDAYTAKIADFGASRLVPMDQTQVTTLVQGTLGYLDPEYFRTSQLTEKSDVYSFGVVLAELLTREKPLCMERRPEDRNLATYFVLAIKEDRLLEIIYPQIIKEANGEQLASIAKLVKRCLNINGEDRPTMKEVSMELEGLKSSMKHPWAEPSYDGDTSLMGHAQQDLYPVPMRTSTHMSEEGESGQYSVQMDMVGMNQPR